MNKDVLRNVLGRLMEFITGRGMSTVISVKLSMRRVNNEHLPLKMNILTRHL